MRTLLISQLMAAGLGFVTYTMVGSGYLSGDLAMVLTIGLDVVHPPAVATSLSFALRSGNESNLLLFGLALGITATLVMLEKLSLWVLARHSH